jgi:glycosyltransferase involved in cell wall biosynthesis
MIKSQKIAVLCNYELLPERVGGMDYFFWMFDKRCKESSIQVDWFFPNQSHHGEYVNLIIYDSNYQNIENYFLDYYKANQQDYSHIITHFVELCTPFFYKIKQISTAKIIVIDHNPRPIDGYPIKKRIIKRIKGILYSRHIDLFFGVSDYTVSEILNDFGSHLQKKSTTIYNGVLTNDILVRNDRNTVKPSFLVASHLRESKGIQDLIEAVHLLPAEIKKEIQIDIYGEGPYKPVLKQKIQGYKIEHNFRFMGSQPNLKEIFCQYDYMVQPTHMECFSLSILESLAANVPVITTNVGGNEEAITNNENGYIYKAKDVNALSTILKKVFQGEIKITANARKSMEDSFSLETMVEKHFKTLF